MITKILALKNVGAFENWEWPHDTAADALPPFGRVTVVAGENGKGKTTIASVLRSLQDNDPGAVLERRRGRPGGLFEDFLVKVEHSGGKSCLSSDSGWNGPRPTVFVFDDMFVARNVYEGLSVGAEQREALHELVIGEAGVQEAQKSECLAKELSDLKRDLKELAAKLSKDLRHISLERVLGESPPENIDAALAAVALELQVAAQAAPIRGLRDFASLPVLPNVPVETVRDLLATTIERVEEAAQNRVLDHFRSLGGGADAWVHTGLGFLGTPVSKACPFCTQELGDASNAVIAAYRAHFNNEYKALQNRCVGLADEIQRTIPESWAMTLSSAYERLTETHRQWIAYLPDLPSLPPCPDLSALPVVRRGLLEAVEAKRLAPLAQSALSEETIATLEGRRQTISQLDAINSVVAEIQRRCRAFVEGTVGLDEPGLKRRQAELQEWKSVELTDFQKGLSDYRATATAIELKAKALEGTKAALQKYQDDQFPIFRDAINRHLDAFGATFSLAEVTKTKGAKGGERRVDYVLKAASTSVRVSSSPATGAPHFGSLLSAGDRRTLAFAFFLAMLQGKRLDGATIVCDDPTTSLDVDRRSRTVVELLGLVKGGAQLLVLSHYEPLLLDLEDRVGRTASADNNAQLRFACFRIQGGKHRSRLAAHRLDRRTMLDRHRDAVRAFVEGTTPDQANISNECRKLLEGVVRVSFPDHYPPGGCLKEFCQRVESVLDQGSLDRATFDEIRNLRDFFNTESHFQPDGRPTDNEVRANAARLLQLAQLRLGTVGP